MAALPFRVFGEGQTYREYIESQFEPLQPPSLGCAAERFRTTQAVFALRGWGTEVAHDPSYIHIGKRKIHRAWLILVGCCFLQAGGLGNILTSASPFYVPVCDDLGFQRAQLSLYITAYFLSGIIGMPIAGQLLARCSTRVVMTVCVAAVSIATCLMGTYTELWQWLLTGCVYGTFGSAVFMVPYSSMIGNWFVKRSGIAMGIASCCAALMAAIMVPIYTQLIMAIGWRATYVVQGLVLAVLVLPWTLFVFRIKPQTMGAVPYGIEDLPALAEGQERSVPGVPFNKGIKTGAFLCCLLFAGISSLIGSGFDGHIPGHAIAIGFDAVFGAVMVSALQFGSFCDKILTGFINDKIGIRKTVFIELGAVALGVLGLIFFREQAPILVACFLFGIQDSLLAVSAPQILKNIFGEKDFTRLYAWMSIGVSIISSFSQVLVGLSYDMTGSFVPAFVGALVVCGIGALLVILAYRLGRNLEWVD